MRSQSFVFLVMFLVIQSCGTKEKNNFDPDSHLTSEEQNTVKQSIIRYVAKTPRRVMDSIKFDTAYDAHYAEQVRRHELMAYFIAPNGEHFFLVSRIAPSIEEKRVATGGRMRFEQDWNLVEYEEVFRTWKMNNGDLDVRARYLFELMVKGEDLTPYYAATAGFNYIEFPDEHVYFDTSSRSWKSDIYGSVEEMVYDSRNQDSLQKK
jgi:hypothetical protein